MTSHFLVKLIRIIFLLLCIAGCETQGVNSVFESAKKSPGAHAKISKVILVTGDSKDQMVVYSRIQILRSLEAQFKKEKMSYVVYPGSSAELASAIKEMQPSHLIYLNVLNASWRAGQWHPQEGSEYDIVGFSYQMKIVDASDRSNVLDYYGTVMGQQPGRAATQVGFRFFEWLRKEELI